MSTLYPRPRLSGLGTVLLTVFVVVQAGCVIEGDDVYESTPLPEVGGAGGGGDAAAGGGGDAAAGSGGAGGADAPIWSDVEPIIVAKCGACHGDPPSRGAPFPLISYADASTHAERAVTRVQQRSMPPPGSPTLTDAEISRLQAWFDAGTPEAAPQAAAATWATIEPIMIARCGGCHGDPLTGGAPFPLLDFINASTHAERSAIRAELGTMPPQGLGFAACTPAEVAQLRAWANAGAPE